MADIVIFLLRMLYSLLCLLETICKTIIMMLLILGFIVLVSDFMEKTILITVSDKQVVETIPKPVYPTGTFEHEHKRTE